jgi:mRNA-degrading endonuclease RelE of RelBE toxin-antitoxin system
MTYKLRFLPSALKEWKKLDQSIKQQFKKKLKERLANPHIPSAQLFSYKDHYKIKLRSSGYRNQEDYDWQRNPIKTSSREAKTSLKANDDLELAFSFLLKEGALILSSITPGLQPAATWKTFLSISRLSMTIQSDNNPPVIQGLLIFW